MEKKSIVFTMSYLLGVPKDKLKEMYELDYKESEELKIFSNYYDAKTLRSLNIIRQGVFRYNEKYVSKKIPKEDRQSFEYLKAHNIDVGNILKEVEINQFFNCITEMIDVITYKTLFDIGISEENLVELFKFPICSKKRLEEYVGIYRELNPQNKIYLVNLENIKETINRAFSNDYVFKYSLMSMKNKMCLNGEFESSIKYRKEEIGDIDPSIFINFEEISKKYKRVKPIISEVKKENSLVKGIQSGTIEKIEVENKISITESDKTTSNSDEKLIKPEDVVQFEKPIEFEKIIESENSVEPEKSIELVKGDNTNYLLSNVKDINEQIKYNSAGKIVKSYTFPVFINSESLNIVIDCKTMDIFRVLGILAGIDLKVVESITLIVDSEINKQIWGSFSYLFKNENNINIVDLSKAKAITEESVIIKMTRVISELYYVKGKKRVLIMSSSESCGTIIKSFPEIDFGVCYINAYFSNQYTTYLNDVSLPKRNIYKIENEDIIVKKYKDSFCIYALLSVISKIPMNKWNTNDLLDEFFVYLKGQTVFTLSYMDVKALLSRILPIIRVNMSEDGVYVSYKDLEIKVD